MTIYFNMLIKKVSAIHIAVNLFLKFICVGILLFMIAFSVKATPDMPYTLSVDTSFKRTDPDLIYTTRDYYFNLGASSFSNVAIKDFMMILTFNIGVTMKDEIKQLGFKEATMDFSVKQGSASFTAQTFTKYEHTFNTQGNKLSITFFPDKPKSAATKALAILKCIFTGTVKKGGVTGLFTFYLHNGEQMQVQFNPGL